MLAREPHTETAAEDPLATTMFEERKQTLNYLLAGHGVLALILLICCFVVAGTANAGFNAVLTGLSFAFFTVSGLRGTPCIARS